MPRAQALQLHRIERQRLRKSDGGSDVAFKQDVSYARAAEYPPRAEMFQLPESTSSFFIQWIAELTNYDIWNAYCKFYFLPFFATQETFRYFEKKSKSERINQKKRHVYVQ